MKQTSVRGGSKLSGRNISIEPRVTSFIKQQLRGIQFQSLRDARAYFEGVILTMPQSTWWGVVDRWFETWWGVVDRWLETWWGVVDRWFETWWGVVDRWFES